MATAAFSINGDSETDGYQASNGQTLTLRLRQQPPIGVNSVQYQVFDPAGADPGGGIAANPPRSSKGAPTLTLVGGASGQTVAPATVDGAVTVSMPGSGGHSFIIRCVVNGGTRLVGNTLVVDPSLISERGVWIPTAFGGRKVVITETNQFEPDGWAGAIADFIETGNAPVTTFVPLGAGAVTRTVTSRLSEAISVFDFMTEAEKTDALNGTLIYDLQPAIQAAIDWALYRSTTPGAAAGPRVWVPGAVYRIDRPIHVGYGVDPRSLIFEGEGNRYGGGLGIAGGGTAIYANFTDAPALVIQGGYHVIVRNLYIQGKNADWIYAKNFAGAHTMADVNASAWVDPALPASASSRYAPYAGIAIDPYSGTRPGTSYPDVDYPDFLGAVAQYGKFFSSNVLIENVGIWGFVIGVAVQPCDADGNGDFVKLRRVMMRFCAYGLSWGNSQSRVLRCDDCLFTSMHTALASAIHGHQTGEPGLLVTSCSFDLMMRIIDMGTPNYGQCPTFVGCFAEAIYSIGLCNGGGAQASSGIKFLGCQFGFSWWEVYGVPTYIYEMGGAASATSFESCFFYAVGTSRHGVFLHFRADWNTYEGGKNLQLVNCHHLPLDPAERYQQCAFNATLGVSVSYGSTSIERYAMGSGYAHNLDTGTSHTEWYTERSRGPRSDCLPVYAKQITALQQGGDPGVPVAWPVRTIPATLVGISGRRVTLTLTGATTASLMHTGGDVGDAIVCQDTGAAFLVRSRTGTQIVMEAASGFDVDDNLLAAVPASPSIWPIHCRRYALGIVCYADIASGSPVVTNVKAGGAPADLAANITVGDYLFVNDELEGLIDPADARVVSFDNTAKTITFAGNFTVSHTRRRLAIFVRPAMPNAA